MHEYSIVQSLIDSVEAAAGRRDAAVHRIEVAIGELAGVDCQLLTTAFEVFRAGTICEHAALAIDRIPAIWECPECRAEVGRGALLTCARCRVPVRLAAGDEIVLQRIELEVA